MRPQACRASTAGIEGGLAARGVQVSVREEAAEVGVALLGLSQKGEVKATLEGHLSAVIGRTSKALAVWANFIAP